MNIFKINMQLLNGQSKKKYTPADLNKRDIPEQILENILQDNCLVHNLLERKVMLQGGKDIRASSNQSHVMKRQKENGIIAMPARSAL